MVRLAYGIVSVLELLGRCARGSSNADEIGINWYNEWMRDEIYYDEFTFSQFFLISKWFRRLLKQEKSSGGKKEWAVRGSKNIMLFVEGVGGWRGGEACKDKWFPLMLHWQCRIHPWKPSTAEFSVFERARIHIDIVHLVSELDLAVLV